MMQRHVAIKNEPGAVAASSNALTTRPAMPLVTKIEREALIADEMGSEVTTIYIGPENKQFQIHTDLLKGVSKLFSDGVDALVAQGHLIAFEKYQPATFKLFIEYLYTKKIPSVHDNLGDLGKGIRLRELCQLYCMAENFEVNNELLNRIMDRIQDGFLMIKKFPNPTLIQKIFENTRKSNMLREFCVHGVIFEFRHAPVKTTVDAAGDAVLSNLLASSEDFRMQFLAAIRKLFIMDLDPRIRECHGDPECLECLGKPAQNPADGVWPCQFHNHRSLGENGEFAEDHSCHLWRASRDSP